MESIEFVNYETGWCSDEYKCIELRRVDCIGKESEIDVIGVGEDGMQL